MIKISTILTIFLTLNTYALTVVGESKQKIKHNLPNFSSTFILVNNKQSPEIIVNVKASKNKCYAIFPKEPIMPGVSVSIRAHCNNLVSSTYTNTYRLTYTGSQGTKVITLRQSGHAFRTDCGDVDLDRVGGSMEHVKVRNQKQTPFCMYNSISQINDALRFDQGIKNYDDFTSAEELALSYWKNRNYKNTPTGLGNTGDDVFSFLMNRGSCFESSVSTNIRSRILGVITTIFKEGNFKTYAKSQYLPNRHYTLLNKKIKEYKINLKHNLSLNILKTYVQKQQYIAFTQYLLGPISCNKKLTLPNNSYKLVSDIIYPTSHVQNKLKNDNSMPIMAMLSTDFFKDEYSEGIWPWQTNHAVLITGKRLNKSTGRCQIKIRNSWGHKSSYKNTSLDVDLKNGSFWVNESTLSKHLGQTYSVY